MSQVERQREELLRVAGGFGRFSGLDGPALIRGRKAAAQLLAALRRLGAVLRGVLAPAAHADVAAALLQPLAASICGEPSAGGASELPACLPGTKLSLPASGLPGPRPR